MVILIASDDAGAAQALMGHLKGRGRHHVHTVGTMRDLEEFAASTEPVDVLLFGGSFDNGRGKELRDTLRRRLPRLRTAQITGQDGLGADPQKVAEWVEGLEQGTEVRGPAALGDYDLKERLLPTATTDSFRAVQRSVNREVILERLKPELSRDPAAVREFRAMVRARANVSCPWIATVYEAQETGGEVFYTRELVRGLSVDELAAARKYIKPEESLHLLRAAAEAMTWMSERGAAREGLRSSHLYHGTDGAPRIGNIAAAGGGAVDEPGEIRAIGEAVRRVTDFKVGPPREISHVLGLMKATGPQALVTWKAVLRETRGALQRMTEAHTTPLTAGRDHPRARRRSRGPLIVSIILSIAACGGTLMLLSKKPPANREDRDISTLILVPAGEFTFRESTRVNLPDFWIDSHEVTIRQYAGFLSSGAGKKFDHEKQPKEKTDHEPKDWSEILRAARAGGTWHGCAISMNCPVFNVDWWDAYAYAAWKGRRLPTEEEWEKAARGTNGRRWPWGNEEDPKRANTGADYDPRLPGKGAIDGFSWWCEVDAMPDDISAYDVTGMAGNVSEWTSTWEPHPDLPDIKVPVFRGGDFSRQSAAPLSTQWLASSASQSQTSLGFRTASSSPPPVTE